MVCSNLKNIVSSGSGNRETVEIEQNKIPFKKL